MSRIQYLIPNSYSHIPRFIGAVIAQIGYGREFYEKHGDALIKLSLENMELVVSVIYKFWAVDLFPLCTSMVSYAVFISSFGQYVMFRRGFLGPSFVVLGPVVRTWAGRSDLSRLNS